VNFDSQFFDLQIKPVYKIAVLGSARQFTKQLVLSSYFTFFFIDDDIVAAFTEGHGTFQSSRPGSDHQHLFNGCCPFQCGPPEFFTGYRIAQTVGRVSRLHESRNTTLMGA